MSNENHSEIRIFIFLTKLTYTYAHTHTHTRPSQTLLIIHHFLCFADASYNGGISPSSDDGVLLGRALRGELLLLERDFAGGFKAEENGGSSSSTYAGEIKALAGPTIPAGWLVCDGRAVDRVDFSALFAAIGTTWGEGDGTTTFNIPDLRGRTAIGAGKGETGGSVEKKFVESAKVSEHKLGNYDGSEIMSFKKATGSLSLTWGVGWSWSTKHALSNVVLAFDGGSLLSTSTRNNMMPFAAVTYIIKT